MYIYVAEIVSIHPREHESAQRNVAGHLIDKNVFKTTRSFRYQWFRISTRQANATEHGRNQL